MISEEYKSRIQKLAGLLSESELLTENDTDKLRGLGFSDGMSNFLLEFNKKYSVFLGNILTKEFAKEKGSGGGHIKNILPMLDQEELVAYSRSKVGELNYVLEWIKDANVSGQPVDLRQIDSLSEAVENANEWNSSKEAKGKIEDESGTILKTYPDNDYWIDLHTNNSSVEAAAMGHCGVDSSATTLFSLRDKNKEPHVTIAYNGEPDKLYVTQVKGKRNQPPVEKYIPFVYDFLRDMANKGTLKGFNWRYSNDLNLEQIKNIFVGEKFKEYVYNMLIKNLDNTSYSKLEISMDEAKKIIGEELYKKYIYKQLGKVLENPAYNRLNVSQEEIKRVIGEENHKKFVTALVQKLLESDNIHSLGSVLQKLRDNYDIHLTQQELKTFVGDEKYKEYIRALLDKAMENPVLNRLEVTKQEIVDELGLQSYVEYVEKILEKLSEDPSNKKLNLSKEEVIETIGKEKYDAFIINIIEKLINSDNVSGVNGVLAILKSNYDVDLTAQQLKEIIGDYKFEKYIKDLYDKAMISPFENKLDVSKDVIIDELGYDKYVQYISRILDVTAEDPINKRTNLTKEEIIDTVGEPIYNDFVKKVVTSFVDNPNFYGIERLLSLLRTNFGIDVTKEQAMKLVPIQKWFGLVKRSAARTASNIGR